LADFCHLKRITNGKLGNKDWHSSATRSNKKCQQESTSIEQIDMPFFIMKKLPKTIRFTKQLWVNLDPKLGIAMDSLQLRRMERTLRRSWICCACRSTVSEKTCKAIAAIAGASDQPVPYWTPKIFW